MLEMGRVAGGDPFWAEEAEGGEVGKSPCLAVGKQAK